MVYMMKNFLYSRPAVFGALVISLLVLYPLLSVVLSNPPAKRAKRAVQGAPPIEVAIDTAVPTDGLLTVYGGTRMAGERGFPIGAGDINGDGRADVIMGGLYASPSAGNRINNGLISFYLSDGRDTGSVDQAQNPPNIFTLVGANSGDLLGTSVSANGDVNGDGLRDVLIGAGTDDGPNNSRTNSGAAYLVYGAPNFAMNADLFTIDATGTPPPGVVAIYGAQVNGRAGIWCDLGDVDKDGFADIVIGSDQLSNQNGTHVGGCFIVFGAANLPPIIDLVSPPAGVRTVRVWGEDHEDHWGAALHVGDINNDGFGDVVIGGSIFRDSGSYVSPGVESGHNSFGANFNGQRLRCGEAYVIYGKSNWTDVDLHVPPATATRIIGAREGDLLGSQLHSADLNGDGKTELIIGALQATAPDQRGNTGAVYVIYGGSPLHGLTIDLAQPDPPGITISRLYGEKAGDCAGDSVRSYDINKDGLSDLFIGSPEYEFALGGVNRSNAGNTVVIFGQRDVLPPVIKFYDPPASPKLYMLTGSSSVDGGDEFSYRLAGADVDGDGYTDYLANAMHGDGINDGLTNAGQVHVFSGKKLSARLNRLPTDPGPDPTAPQLASASLSSGGQPVAQANAGQAGLQVTVNGANFTASTEVLINNQVVVASTPAGFETTRRLVSLDANPAVRNSVGNLAVRVRNTNPATPLSDEVVAGRLVGPEITSIRVKVKANGKTILRVSGVNFPSDAIATVTVAGQAVTLANVFVEASDFISVIIKPALAPPAGAAMRIRIVTGAGIQSNEFTVVKP